MSDFQVVDRPKPKNPGKRRAMIEAILATLDTDRSVRIEQTGQASFASLANVRWFVRGHHPDLRLVTKTIDGVVHLWVERRRDVSVPAQGNQRRELVGAR